MTRSEGLRPSMARLAEGLAGRVIEPGDPSYDELRAVMLGGFDRRPAAIVRTANASALVGVKRRYDPANLFRLNQNIPPTG